ncbi:YggT family protein [Nocardia bovistercoris]|uniref:YggT family protein n=1 Tax=Nocardia bovistercoris TaxID=2785916 RepID=A0A931N0N4_9NOCA|nr:YggT family protein [Nocardia bovistercoris]MBH0774862.1 YggT family protein [Nocardia bovistercoris]
MSLIGTVLGYALTLFIVIMIARMILDWVVLLGRTTTPWVLRARDLATRATEPVIAPVRKVLPPVRAGGLAIDLAFTIVFIVALVLRGIAFSL